MKKLLSVLAGCFVILLCLGRVSNGAEWSDEEKSALSALGTQMDVLIEILQLYNEAALDRPADMSSCLKEMFAMRKLGKCRDKFSYYIPSEEVQGWREGVSGEFGGIGIEVTQKDDRVVVVAPIEGTPGEREGFQPEDIILEVDNKEVNNTKQVVDLIRGPAGSKVEIKFWRKGFAEPKTVVVVREKIIVQSVKSRELSVAGQKIKVIKVNTFGEKTYRQFKDAFTEAKTKGTKLVALDFRNNPGGLLNEALKMLALFMRESDTALTYRTRNETVPYDAAYLRSQKELGIRSFGEFRDFKIVLLVNKGSASASEIFAGTMKDWGYTVIGEQSFGKGVGQSCIPLSDDSVFCLTTFEFLVGNNRVSIRDKGVVPTVVVRNSDNKAEDKQLDKAVEFLLGQ